MRVLVVGSGGREHALAWRLRQSPQLTDLWVAGGNAGTAQVATNLSVNPEDVDAVVTAAQAHRIDLVVVGPEVPLANGLVDKLAAAGIPAFGPTRAAAQIEASKGFARSIMQEAGVPGPDYHVFHDQQSALDFVRKNSSPVVVKADGLAAGKGVAMCHNPEEASVAVKSCMNDRLFGNAGETIVIEEMLSGPEVSVFAFCDGEQVSTPIAACDYKRIGDGDQGPNTGGMGSFTPPNFWTESLAKEIVDRVMRPTAEVMASRGTPYQGILYAGVMLTEDGPRVLEFNCRFGDPETQVILPLLRSDPIAVMLACAQGRLDKVPVEWRDQAHVGVVMTSGGYPEAYETDFEIHGLALEQENTQVFHAGTRLLTDGGVSRVATSGGRVLTVTGWGDSLDDARARAYRRVESISFEGAYYRKDIGTPRSVPEGEVWSPGQAAQTS
ncbi:MAG: phosphoribosylamine--glycine ligase [Chloroflexi bacterium]|nr:phosphoribosylamine--glycine ligase [Chloroflexota bacterium]MDA1218194.1 phosphoribosylamine--glycine ligase [Chloroflexota bacterium]PKB57540.1 MAG: phosphoribosylamine--glycine ligase [SAR202 cluster bacterium Casp-Chloro-G3]